MGAIERQRRDQERMLRALANGEIPTGLPHHAMCLSSIELSDDIRGERLRFVEAMKEATAINVQSMVSYCSPVATVELTASV